MEIEISSKRFHQTKSGNFLQKREIHLKTNSCRIFQFRDEWLNIWKEKRKKKTNKSLWVIRKAQIEKKNSQKFCWNVHESWGKVSDRISTLSKNKERKNSAEPWFQFDFDGKARESFKLKCQRYESWERFLDRNSWKKSVKTLNRLHWSIRLFKSTVKLEWNFEGGICLWCHIQTRLCYGTNFRFSWFKIIMNQVTSYKNHLQVCEKSEIHYWEIKIYLKSGIGKAFCDFDLKVQLKLHSILSRANHKKMSENRYSQPNHHIFDTQNMFWRSTHLINLEGNKGVTNKMLKMSSLNPIFRNPPKVAFFKKVP